jgi:hypothetical protein
VRSPRRRRLVSHGLRVNAYKLISRAVEEGIARGWQRSHKHTDCPDPSFVRQQVEEAVMLELSEIFIWPDVE